MCDVAGLLHTEPSAEDEYVLDTVLVRDFVAAVRAAASDAGTPTEACAAVAPVFEALMRERDWIPEAFSRSSPESGMGGGIGQWLIFRSAARDLCLFNLVVPPGSMTPIHDHLAWGLIGLYQGNQDEEIYAPADGSMQVVRRRPLEPGDFYALLPPRDDIHRVRTTSDVPSVSIHLLANDTGCVERHVYDEHTGRVEAFRSGYGNAECGKWVRPPMSLGERDRL